MHLSVSFVQKLLFIWQLETINQVTGHLSEAILSSDWSRVIILATDWSSIRGKLCSKTLKEIYPIKTHLSPSLMFDRASLLSSSMLGSVSLAPVLSLHSWDVTSILGTGRELLLFLGCGSASGEKFRPFSRGKYLCQKKAMRK